MPTTTTALPAYDNDLFTEEAILDPYPHYAALRELGPVVSLTAHGVLTLPRYDAARAALDSPDHLISGEGTGLNDVINTVARETTLNSDGALHAHLRAMESRSLAPKALRAQKPHIESVARALVDDLVARGSFDAVTDLAQVMPMSIVPDLLGWPADGRENLLDFGTAVFNAFGPDGERSTNAFPTMGGVFQYTGELAATGNLAPGSLGADILAARDAGEITDIQTVNILADFLAPSLDTTTAAIGSAIWLFGKNPDQWNLVRANPEMIPAALNEVLRLESPIRLFTRFAATDWTFEGSTVAAGSRVVVMYGSANRDDRKFPHAEVFDVTRNAVEHLGFGYGIHGCVGQGLARMEIHALLGALVESVARFEVGEPTLQVNNLIRARASLPVTVYPA